MMSNFSLEKMKKIAEELNIEIEFNSDNPGHFIVENGVERKLNIDDILPEPSEELNDSLFKESFSMDRLEEKFQISGLKAITSKRNSGVKIKAESYSTYFMEEAKVS
ncbi:hypothetical protein V2177_17760 [Bacillus licheniformis]|jgi:hypothetical protein|nr:MULTISPECIES: hypothetical protein [Bacillus]ARC63910.1 hypothetical protein B14_00885 [Bacillus licheniformis]ARC69631.1 hypothetical protein B34_02215 [Bacillus licheniformis]ASV16906.1 hypothetical protein CJO35_17810 [Bacillus sp. 1s-1]EQM26326.1 hypothetical protein N399_19575 [Bacillus licheniformis CG-B52]MBU8738152.1 hypothetical protein [Bacillus licheniformis]